jgi:hypothetical protein
MVLADPGLLLTPPPSSGLLTTGAGLQSAAEFGHTEAVLSLVQECGDDARDEEKMAPLSSTWRRGRRGRERQSEPPKEAAEDVVVGDCVCTSGYEGDNATMCKEFPAAKYKASVANAACVPCNKHPRRQERHP